MSTCAFFEPPSDQPDLKYGYAIAMSTTAGLATCIGGSVVFCTKLLKLTDKQFLAIGLALAAGVMVFVTYVDIYTKSITGFSQIDADITPNSRRPPTATLYAVLSFFAGVIIMKLQDMLVHHFTGHSHHTHGAESPQQKSEDPEGVCGDSAEAETRRPSHASYLEEDGKMVDHFAQMKKEGQTDKAIMDEVAQKQALVRVGFSTAVAILLHNLPEGIATFTAALGGGGRGVALAFAVGLHNIPEGICVAVPILYGTGSAWKGFLYAALSGISEPIGALIAYLVIELTGSQDSMSDGEGNDAMGVVFGFIAGFMAFIVFAELLPVAYRYDPKDKVTTIFLFLGMLILAISIWAIEYGQDEKTPLVTANCTCANSTNATKLCFTRQ